MIKLDSGVRRFDTVFVVALLTLFAITAALLILISAKQYNLTTEQSNGNYNRRTISSYLREQVRHADSSNAITVKDSCLVMTQQLEAGNFCTYIYAYNGYLCEAFLKEDVQLSPAAGQKIIPVSSFEPVIDSHNNLIVNYITVDGDSREVIIDLKVSKGGTSNE